MRNDAEFQDDDEANSWRGDAMAMHQNTSELCEEFSRLVPSSLRNGNFFKRFALRLRHASFLHFWLSGALGSP